MGCVGMFGLVAVCMLPFVALVFDTETAFAFGLALAVGVAVLSGALGRSGSSSRQ